MLVSQLLAMALGSASMSGTAMSAAGLPPIANSKISKQGQLDKRQLDVAGLPELTSADQGALMDLYNIYTSAKSAKNFVNELRKSAPPGKTLETLATKLSGGSTGGRLRGALDQTPGRPQTVVFTYVLGIGTCLVDGKSFKEAVECGKNDVRNIQEDIIELPEPCNNLLGQLELFGTGWPAPCHDDKGIQHPQGSAAKRKLKWGLCKFFSWIQGEEITKAEEEHIGTCDKRFPTDQQERDELCKKYFGGTSCRGTVPLNNENDFQKLVEVQNQYKQWLAEFDVSLGFQSVVEVQAEMPDVFKNGNKLPLNGETCRGNKCGQVCQGNNCTPTREVCEPVCKPDTDEGGKCNCGWDQIQQKCNSCHVDKCGECVIKPITQRDGALFAGTPEEQLHVECRDNKECYFVPDRK